MKVENNTIWHISTHSLIYERHKPIIKKVFPDMNVREITRFKNIAYLIYNHHIPDVIVSSFVCKGTLELGEYVDNNAFLNVENVKYYSKMFNIPCVGFSPDYDKVKKKFSDVVLETKLRFVKTFHPNFWAGVGYFG